MSAAKPQCRLAWLALSLIASHAGAAELDSRWSLESAAVAASPRSDTALNPQARLLDAREETLDAAAHWVTRWEEATLFFRADAWLQTTRDVHRETSDTQAVIPEAYVSWKPQTATSVAGGIGLFRWGTGYAWNPANPFTDINANNTSRARPYRRDGDPYAALEYSGDSTLGAYVVDLRQTDPLLARTHERDTWGGLRYQTVLQASDISFFVASARGESFFGAASSTTVGQQLELHGELGWRTHRYAPTITRVPLGPGAPDLPVWDFTPRRDATTSALVGGQYTFTEGANVIVEYFYNGNGFNDTEFADFSAAASDARVLIDDAAIGNAARGFLLDANRMSGRLRRHYAFARLARDRWIVETDVHAYVRVGLEDQARVVGWLLRRPFGDFTLALSGEHYGGPADAETHLIPVRARYELALQYSF